QSNGSSRLSPGEVVTMDSEPTLRAAHPFRPAPARLAGLVILWVGQLTRRNLDRVAHCSVIPVGSRCRAGDIFRKVGRWRAIGTSAAADRYAPWWVIERIGGQTAAFAVIERKETRT